MKRRVLMSFTTAVVLAATGILSVHAGDAAYEAERRKAEANPYANDLGPDRLPAELLATYPQEYQDAYKNVLLVKCARCHTAARPINSQFFEPFGKGPEKEAHLDSLKKSSPELFENKNLFRPDPHIWERYVKRMMAKPGCGISRDEGKAVWKFLVYDSNRRKTGKNKAAWLAHRKKLLTEFKKKYPKRYAELYEGDR